MIKKILIISSFSLNFIFLLISVFVLTRQLSSIAFLDLNSTEMQYTTGANIVSVPEGSEFNFGPPEISIRIGQEAALQFSIFANGRQLNMGLEALYDRSVISVEPSGYGLIITGLGPGETIVQILTIEGFRDIAIIRVAGYLP